MSVTVAKADGVTVLTLSTDPNSFCPPLCQILRAMCCNPQCCAVSQQLQQKQTPGAQSLLGALHIMTGLLSIGIIIVLLVANSVSWIVMETYFPIWFGALFIFFGAMCILSERYPSPCLVILNVTVNIVAFAFAVAAIVLYSQNLAHLWMQWRCDADYYVEKTQWFKLFSKKCLERIRPTVVLVKGLDVLLIILSVMEVCVAISSVVLGIKAFGKSAAREEKRAEDPEVCTPLLEEGTDDP